MACLSFHLGSDSGFFMAVIRCEENVLNPAQHSLKATSSVSSSSWHLFYVLSLSLLALLLFFPFPSFPHPSPPSCSAGNTLIFHLHFAFYSVSPFPSVLSSHPSLFVYFFVVNYSLSHFSFSSFSSSFLTLHSPVAVHTPVL